MSTAHSPVAQTAPQLYCQLLAAGMGQTDLRQVREACLLAVQKTSHLLRGSGKPFSCHLIGVASLVAEATNDVDLVVAALLHALYQPRVSFLAEHGGDSDSRAWVAECFNSHVETILHAYQAAGPLLPEATELVTDAAREVRILQLADQLEDALDGAPWWHGGEGDLGDERGSAMQRVAQIRALEPVFALAPALGAPTLLSRYLAVTADWNHRDWPACLRSGEYSTYPSATAGTP